MKLLRSRWLRCSCKNIKLERFLTITFSLRQSTYFISIAFNASRTCSKLASSSEKMGIFGLIVTWFLDIFSKRFQETSWVFCVCSGYLSIGLSAEDCDFIMIKNILSFFINLVTSNYEFLKKSLNIVLYDYLFVMVSDPGEFYSECGFCWG